MSYNYYYNKQRDADMKIHKNLKLLFGKKPLKTNKDVDFETQFLINENTIDSINFEDKTIHKGGSFYCCNFKNCHFTYTSVSQFYSCNFKNCTFDVNLELGRCDFKRKYRFKVSNENLQFKLDFYDEFSRVHSCVFKGDCVFNGEFKFIESCYYMLKNKDFGMHVSDREFTKHDQYDYYNIKSVNIEFEGFHFSESKFYNCEFRSCRFDDNCKFDPNCKFDDFCEFLRGGSIIETNEYLLQIETKKLMSEEKRRLNMSAAQNI